LVSHPRTAPIEGHFASLAAWGFGRVGRSLVAELPRYQALYSAMVTWLDGHGVSVAGLWAEHFNVGWLLRATQYVTGRVNTTLSFWVIALIYVMLGLLEVENVRQKIERLDNRTAAGVLLDGSAATAAKFRRYLLVRTKMSAVTGLLVGIFAAIGWSNARIMMSIVIEGILMCVSGCVLGVLLSLLAAFAFPRIPAIGNLISFKPSVALIAPVVVAAFVLCVLGALLPAWRAVRMVPAEANTELVSAAGNSDCSDGLGGRSRERLPALIMLSSTVRLWRKLTRGSTVAAPSLRRAPLVVVPRASTGFPDSSIERQPPITSKFSSANPRGSIAE